MKALISRDSHRPRRRYSGVYHIQGAMITDADLDERSAITLDRTDHLGDDAIKDGVPAKGGAVVFNDADGTVSLREGVIYADGVRGLLAAAEGAALNGPLDIVTKQADLPLGPALPAQGELVLYADIWERPVFPLEDPYLADAGLHGAVTGFRTRTMTQLKAAPATALGDIEAGIGAFPRIGTARIAVTPLNAEILADECDPCADVVSAEQQVANALWRLEIIAIQGTPNNPTRIVMAWSEENAAEIAPATVSAEAFERVNKVYEYFSPITEARAGVYANATDAKLPAFVDDLAATPTPTKDHNGQNWPFVRRWDGVATINPGANQILDRLGGGFELSMSAGRIALRVTAFDVEIDLRNAAVVPGDYWLVEMRRHAPETERIRLVQEAPIGILHHYCTLFTVRAGRVGRLSDAQRRKLSFPTLPDLPADHVGLVNNCAKLYGDAENVQDALDELCSISADDIGFDSSHCPVLYDQAQTVQQALDALCRIDFSVEESFRLLFDWGVICGIVPKLATPGTGLIAITPGSYLDRSGKIIKFAGGDFDLSKLDIGTGIDFKDAATFAAALRKGEVCLALAAEDGGNTSVHLVPQAIAFGPPDPSFSERVRACVDKRKIIPINDIVTSLPERQQTVANKLFLASSAGGAFHGTARLTRAEFTAADAFSTSLTNAFGSVATAEETDILKQRIDQARLDNPIGNVTGATFEIRQMQQATAVLAAFAETDQERLQRCLCENLFPACPPELGKPPFYVPIACLRGATEGRTLVLRELCPYCCRKQAMTWRAVQYFIGDMRTKVAEQLATTCCAHQEDPVRPRPVYDPQRFTRFNLAGFAEDYKLVNSFLDRPDRLPSEFVTNVRVNDLSVADAVNEMRGMGIDVAETIDLNDSTALDIIQRRLTGIAPEDLLMSGGEVRPGDEVALLAQDGVARGYVTVKRGPRRPPFEVAKPAAVLGEDDVRRAEELTRKAETMKTEYASLEKTRDGLVSDIDRLRTETKGLQEQRQASAEALAAVRLQFTALEKTREGLSEQIVGARRDLAAVEENFGKLVNSLRGAQPVNVILGNDKAELLAALAREGITTIAQLCGLTPATIKKLDRLGLIKESEAADLRTKALDFLKR